MRPRKNLVDIFSTFLKFAEDRFDTWVADYRLHRSMEQQVERLPQSETSEQFWSLYWHRIWQQQAGSRQDGCGQDSSPQDNIQPMAVPATQTRLAESHLLAYLQETCYWTARKMADSGFAGAQSSLADLFQMAIAQAGRVLKGFDTSHGANLEDYASIAFRSVIRDILRQRRETDICSNWALLRKLSQKRLRESLENAGLVPDEIDQHLLAWYCFKTIYVPDRATGTRQLAKPENTTWQAIARLYNQERLKQPNFPGGDCCPTTLEQWLTQTAKWARSYLYPRIESIPSRPYDSPDTEIDLPDLTPDPLAAQIIHEELQHRQQQQTQLNQVLEGRSPR